MLFFGLMNVLNYIGSKHTLFDTIFTIIEKNVGKDKLGKSVFGDLFAGTGTVGFHMKKSVGKVVANDFEYYSYVINKGLLCCKWSKKLEKIIDVCNNLEMVDNGLIYMGFSPNEDCDRMFFTCENAKKCDSVRLYMDKIHKSGEITENEFYFLLASLLVSIDKVANTASVYGAYLKKFKKSALKKLVIEPIHKEIGVVKDNVVLNDNIENILRDLDLDLDIAYLDPPYNQRQYSSNYSPLNYIAHYDENIQIKGMTGLIENYNKSSFCSKVKVRDSFSGVIDKIRAKYLFISYNNEGLLSKSSLKEILEKKGRVILYKIPYKKFKSNNGGVDSMVFEFLWFVEVGVVGEFREEEFVVV